MNPQDHYTIPPDIQARIHQKFPNPGERVEVIAMVNAIGERKLNVGKDQLIRSILILADANKDTIREIIDSNFNNDPRDVIMEAMKVSGNASNYGMTLFE